MRANHQPTWRALAGPLVFAGTTLAIVPFMVLLIGPLEQVNRPFILILFGIWIVAQAVPPYAHHRSQCKSRDTVARRMARLRDAG